MKMHTWGLVFLAAACGAEDEGDEDYLARIYELRCEINRMCVDDFHDGLCDPIFEVTECQRLDENVAETCVIAYEEWMEDVLEDKSNCENRGLRSQCDGLIVDDPTKTCEKEPGNTIEGRPLYDGANVLENVKKRST